MLKKFLIFLGVLFASFFVLIVSLKLENYHNRLEKQLNAIEYVHKEYFINKTYISKYREILDNILSQYQISDAQKDSYRYELCINDVENSSDKIEVSKGYKCLAQIDKKNGKYFNAIKNLSLAAQLSPSEEASMLLANLITETSTDKLEDGWYKEKNKEIETLNSFTNSSDNQLAGRAAYRLALIYSSGRNDELLNSELDLDSAFKYLHLAIEKLGIVQDKQTNIVLLFNQKFVPQASTTILSAILNSDLDNLYNFTVVYDVNDPISLESQKKLESLSEKRKFNIRFIPFPEENVMKYRNYFAIKSNYPKIVLMKGMVEKAVLDLDSAIMLDVDLLVLKDLGNLSRKDIKDHEISAVNNTRTFSNGGIGRFELCKELGGEYFNSGVLYLALKEMRENNNSDKMNELAKSMHCNFVFPEQDILNVLYIKKTNFVSSRYNMIPLYDNLEDRYPNGFMPYVIHYAAGKPWGEEYQNRMKEGKSVPDSIMLYYKYDVLSRKVISYE